MMAALGRRSSTNHPSSSTWTVTSRSRNLWMWHPGSTRQCCLPSARLMPKLCRTLQQTMSQLQIIPRIQLQFPAATCSTWAAGAMGLRELWDPHGIPTWKREHHGFVFKQIIAQAAAFPSVVSVNCWRWPWRGREAVVPFAPCWEEGGELGEHAGGPLWTLGMWKAFCRALYLGKRQLLD